MATARAPTHRTAPPQGAAVGALRAALTPLPAACARACRRQRHPRRLRGDARGAAHWRRGGQADDDRGHVLPHQLALHLRRRLQVPALRVACARSSERTPPRPAPHARGGAPAQPVGRWLTCRTRASPLLSRAAVEGYADERAYWEARSPILRFGKYLKAKGWWDDAHEDELRKASRKRAITALNDAEQVPNPHIKHLFTDVYDEMPWFLEEQQAELKDHLTRYREHYTEIPTEQIESL